MWVQQPYLLTVVVNNGGPSVTSNVADVVKLPSIYESTVKVKVDPGWPFCGILPSISIVIVLLVSSVVNPYK